MEVSKSNLYEKRKESEAPPVPPVESAENLEILEQIRELLKTRPTYGYPRVTPMINKTRIAEGKPPINEKRVYRIMRAHGLTLRRFPCKDGQTHEGKVMTLASNLRWCTDIFGIQCWNGDLVWVIFALDCHDRELMRYAASTIGVDGKLVRDLMVETMEYRFGKVARLPRRVEWLSDRGPQFTARATVDFARSLGFNVCMTPPYSPESNGMAEAFVKTFKRDYVYTNDLSSAVKVLDQLPGWFKDYNENAPHSALKMMAPREYIRAKSAG